MISPLHLGASLYVPATRPDLVPLANGEKLGLRSIILCTEDAIAAHEVPAALRNLAHALRRLTPAPLLRFVRVRTPQVLRELLTCDGVEQLTGFVFPKATRCNLEEYFACLPADRPYLVMPILETAQVFDPAEMHKLRMMLGRDCYRRRILSLRIGGNDLLQLLGLRRPRHRTIYAGPLGPVIAQLVATFRPHGFNLSGPVFEVLGQKRLLARETRRDLEYGLFGKSAIHPEQVPVIEAQYRVPRQDLEVAEKILEPDAPPVFRLHGAMCEPATHRGWAESIVERARLYGVRSDASSQRHWSHVTLEANGVPRQK